MRNLKKFLALVLAFVMAMSLMVTANAAYENTDFSDSETVTADFEEDVTVLNGMEIIKGYEDGTFGPKREVTRAQMAAFVYRIATGDYSDSRTHAYVGYNTFTDVDDDAWYAGYIGYCSNAQYIVGYGNGTFGPDKKVTGYAAMAMILRAMGYNEPGHNFTGDNWRVETSKIATEIGMLEKISKTTYNATLNNNATRELVAEMLFQGLVKPTVQWTTAYGYQSNYFTTDGQSIKGTLGWTNYGLTNHKGVVVGNEVTGEGEHVTQIGFDWDNGFTERVSANNSDAYIYGGNSTRVQATDLIGNPLYNDAGEPVYTNDWETTALMRSFAWDTDLYDFGHAMDVWYNGKQTSKIQTYAMFDRSIDSTVVALDGTTLGDLNLRSTAEGKAIANAGFTSRGAAYLNYAFGPTYSYGWNMSNFASPVKANNSTDDHQLYLLVSNTAGNVVDLVVALDMTITEVTQQNDVTTYPSIGVYNENGTGTSYFDTYDTVSDYTTKSYTQIAQASLLKSTGTKLGDKVVAMTITGTTPGVSNRTITGSGAYYGLSNGFNQNVTYTYSDGTTGSFANHGSGNTVASGFRSTYYYQLTKLTKVVPGTVTKIDTVTQDVYLTNGSVLHKSIFADAVDGTFQKNERVNAPTFFSTYNFYLDEDGNYIFWEPIVNSTNFIYTTYLDYTTPTNSSAYTYSIVGVDINGEGKVVKTPVTQYNTLDAFNTWNKFNENTNYSDSPLPKRDATILSGRVEPGRYVGYTIDQDGVLTVVTPENGANGGTASQPVIQTTVTNEFAAGDVTISENDVKVGAATVVANVSGSQPGLFLTTNTRIYVVGGAGTDTQTVKIYEGIGDLMKGNTQVVIKGTQPVKGTTYLDSAKSATYADMIYYTKQPFTYSQNYVNSAYEIKEIFIPADAIDPTPSVDNNLFFVGNANGGIINAIGGAASQFTVYDSTGAAKVVWISGDYRYDTDSSARTVYENDSNVFYCLVDTGSKAQDDEPIYDIAAVNAFDAAGNPRILGQFWDGTLNCTTIGGIPHNPAKYRPTTYNQQVAFIDATDVINPTDLWNVGSANIQNLNSRTYPGIKDLTTLNDAGALYDNRGVDVSCVLNGTGSSSEVATIFVNAPLLKDTVTGYPVTLY